MKAWRFYAFGDMRLDEVPPPEAKPGWVVCWVRRVQPSITDVQRALGIGTINSDLLRERLERCAPVQLLGHEMSAEVAETGEGVEGLAPGDIVSTSGHVSCGACTGCRAGKEAWCTDKIHVGINTPGAFAEMLAMPAAGLVRVPPTLDDASIVCLQPLSSVVAAVGDARLGPGETVAITGQGVMGLYALQAARMRGAAAVYAVDVKDEALALSRKFQADAAIDARSEDPVARGWELTEGRGADLVFECAGGSADHGLSGHATLHQAFRMVRPGGRVMQVAGLVGEVQVDPRFMRSRGIQWIFPEGHGAETLRQGAEWVATEGVDVRSLVTHEVWGLERLPEAMEITRHKEKYKATNPCQVVLA
ncbi:MAG: zinc-binding dehydrogenase [Nitrospinota bacterium]|nr:zinc-binding dehydrogenase [Nitrospinota bacterium]